MSYSDDEYELIPPTDVTDYKFINGDQEPISFAELPLQVNEHVILDNKSSQQRVYLRGKTDNGLRSIYTEVIAWKFDLSCKNKPDLSVLSMDDNWIKLLKPVRAFEDVIKTVLVTVEFLHLVKWDCNISSKSLWGCLCKRFSMFDDMPCEEDLTKHGSLIREFVKGDEILAESQIISTFLKEKPRKRRYLIEESKPSFIVDKVYDNKDHESKNVDAHESHVDESDDDDDDGCVCAICDNGGAIIQCEGKCMRSFHLTNEVGDDDWCYSLGFTKEQVEQIEDVAFYCKNCKYKQHQCFSCGELGSSDESSFGCVEVFRCINGACGRFYHPGCVAKLLHPNEEVAAKDQSRRISSGEHFTCPAHKCDVCKGLELKSDKQLQFAVCRRCPRAYHRKCLPWNIAFETDVNKGRATVQRAWEDVIPNRILIYCFDHDIDDNLLTPVRNHIKFPPQMDLLEGITYLFEDDKKTENIMSVRKRNNRVTLDDDATKRILSLMKDASTSITLEEINERHEAEEPLRHANSSKLDVDSITLGRVEVSVQAMRAALDILDKGGSVQDAKAVCGDDLLLRLAKWREKMRGYLAPFLCETRYTSLGPRFIKTDKLQEIVNMLHFYIQDGDMMVDICRGSKDFSFLLEKKLEEVGKRCSFKNFDIVQARNDFCFERRDWMTVEPHELPDGSRLIMSLNPPLGVNVALVNKFINKALEFKPKLLILIVPRETQRLDENESSYNLIWEDDEMLAGKSFNLPGSVDDCNMKARILYLWSNPDWTQKYNAVAELRGHPGSRKNCTIEENLINRFEVCKSVGKNNGSPSNNCFEGNLKDSGKNKRKIDMDKKAAAEGPPKKRPAFRGKDHSDRNSSPRIDEKSISKNNLSKTSERQSPGQKRNKDSPRHAPKSDCGNRATTKRCKGEVNKKAATAEKSPTNSPALDPALPKLGSSGSHLSKHLERQLSHVHFRKDGSESYNASLQMGGKGISEFSKNLGRQSLVQKRNYDSPTHAPKLDCSKRTATEQCTDYYPSEGNRKDSEKNLIKGESDKKAAAEEKSPTKRHALNLPLLKLGPSEAHLSKRLHRQSSKIHFWRDRSDSCNSSQRMGDKGLSRSKNLNRQLLVRKNSDSYTHVPRQDCGNRASTEWCTGYPSDGILKNNKIKKEVYVKAAAATKPLNKRTAFSPPLLKLGPSKAHSSKRLERKPSYVNFGEYSSKKHEREPLVQKNNDSPAHIPELDCGNRASTEGDAMDSGENIRKIELDKKAALNHPSLKLCSAVPHSPRHLERQSSHVHSRKDSSDTENALPRMGDKGVKENYTSENLERQLLDQEKNNVSPTHVSKPDCGNMTSTEQCTGYTDNSTSSLSVQSHVGMARSQGIQHVSTCLSRQVNPAAIPAMQKYTPCLENVNHIQKTTVSARPPVIDKNNHPLSARPVGSISGSLSFTMAPYRPPSGTCGWLEE